MICRRKEPLSLRHNNRPDGVGRRRIAIVGFFARRHAPDREQARATKTTALVIEEVAHPEGLPNLGPALSGPLRILADLGSGRRLYDAKVRMSEAHWLVPGMDIEVEIDPNHPDRFEVDWESVPSMEARAAANDPALADPVAARRKVAQVTYKRASAAVLAVKVPGRAPYALYVPRFKCEVDLLEPLWMPLPALVSAVDPTDLEIIWNEVPAHDAQLMDRVAGSVAAQQRGPPRSMSSLGRRFPTGRRCSSWPPTAPSARCNTFRIPRCGRC